ncbi:transcription factor HES-5-like protein [Lates japonicus]|uniref:Transcription factor HES-5-like protein n=1 Tax=Lates japonicus TaxID=270547 RepID=A0AAD3M1L2_LATJO|nr:transcription factor HES-5-like protein [Lates japonicus]
MKGGSSRHIRAQCHPDVAAHLTCTDMAPCSISNTSIHHIRISEKDNIKLRKPIVEKMRRDRINSCIEQLKIILEKEFHKQEPTQTGESRHPEMTVSFLRQQLQPGLCQERLQPGLPHCWRDSAFPPQPAPAQRPAYPLQGLQQQEQHSSIRSKEPQLLHSLLPPLGGSTTLQDSGSGSSRQQRPCGWRLW